MAPLAVVAGLKLPHADAGLQLHFTPPLAESLVTAAATLAVPPSASIVGGMVLSVTAIAGGGGGVDVPPPPQPEVIARIKMTARRGRFLFIVTPP
jgi:hypothetical protein